MKNTVIAIICFLIGVFAVLGYRYYRAKQTKIPVSSIIASPEEPIPQPTFALNPPSEAVSGILTVPHGKVQKLSRNDNSYKEASSGAQILTGESVVTEDLSTAVATISGIANITFGQNAELAFANLYPTDMVVQQKSGKITYEITDTGHPFSVRALHTLASIPSGTITINIVDTDMSITVTDGSIKFALVDNDNNTHVWNLTTGERANIDDATRQVYFVHPLQ